MPITEHPFDGSWGYQPVGYFAPTSRHGTPDDFAYFVDTLHRHGYRRDPRLGPRPLPATTSTAWATSTAPTSTSTTTPGWASIATGAPRSSTTAGAEVRNFLLGNALFWLERYHIDGLRVDAVASMLYLDYSRKPGEWVPNVFGGNENLEAIDFLKRLNELCHQRAPRRPDHRRGIDELVGRLAAHLPRRAWASA